jgi:sulfur-oxidizing protein SoxZ
MNSKPPPAAIRMRARAHDGVTDIVLLMPHPMETGLRKNSLGEPQAAHYITDLRVTLAGRTVLEARLSYAVSQDPLLSFRVRGGQPGERLLAAWIDNRGDSRSDDILVA